MAKVSQTSKDGGTAKSSSVKRNMMHYKKEIDKARYSSDKIESYFSLVENILTPRSNPLLAVEELHLAKQGSMTSQEFHSQILENCEKMPFSKPSSRGKSSQGCNLHWHEQPAEQRTRQSTS